MSRPLFPFAFLGLFILFLTTHGQDLEGLGRTVTNDVTCAAVEEAEAGDEVTIHYEGRLASDGKKFDSSLDRGEPISFILGTGRVIQGWDEGLLRTCPGQSLKLEIPAKLAYGEEGVGNGLIPPNSDLVFELTLVKVKAPKVKIEVTKKVTCAGDKKTRDKDIVVFNYVGKFVNGKVFDSTLESGREPLESTIGEIGVTGWDQALTGACPGEKRRVVVPPHLGYGDEGVADFVPPNTTLILEIEIVKVRNRVLNFLDRISSGNFQG